MPILRHSHRYPLGTQLMLGHSCVTEIPIGDGTIAVRVNERLEGNKGFLIVNEDYVSTGELLTEAEAIERRAYNFH